MNKKSFVLYSDYWQHIKLLNNGQRGVLLTAIFSKEAGEPLPEMDTSTQIVFSFISSQIDRDTEKYEKRCKNSSDNGKKGGAPLGNQNARKNWGEKTTENNPNQAKQSDTVHVHDTANVSDTVSVHDTEEKEEKHIFGELGNVYLTEEQHSKLQEQYRNVQQLIDKVSRWLPNSEKPIKDHYAMCLTFANRDDWPKRPKEPEPEEPIDAVPMPEEIRENIETLGFGRIIGNN